MFFYAVPLILLFLSSFPYFECQQSGLFSDGQSVVIPSNLTVNGVDVLSSIADLRSQITFLHSLVTQSVPVGVIYPYSGTSPPSGFLICDGSSVSRLQYDTLFAVIGTSFGIGDGSTTFNVPDCQGRNLIGSGSGQGLSVRTLGQKIGEEQHVLLTAEIPSHSHADNGHSHNDTGHAHHSAMTTFVGFGSTNECQCEMMYPITISPISP